MSTATKKRRARRPSQTRQIPVGRDAYRVLDQDGEVVAVRGYPDIALTTAQRLAEDYGEEVTFYVERQSLFGPSVELWRVVRDDAGAVWTHTTNQED